MFSSFDSEKLSQVTNN